MIGLVIDISAVLIVGLTIAAALLLVLANVYDFLYAKLGRRAEGVVQKMALSRRPQVTVLVYGRASVDGLEGCLRSIADGRYGKIDIVIVRRPDERLSLSTARHLAAATPIAMRVYNMRQFVNKSEALRRGYSRSRKGEVVVTLHPDMRMDESFVVKAIAMKQASGALAVRFVVRAGQQVSLLSLAPIMRTQSVLVLRKVAYLLGWRGGARLSVGSVYSRHDMRNSRGVAGHTFNHVLHVTTANHRTHLSPFQVAILASAMTGLLLFSLALLGVAAARTTAVPFVILYILICFWMLSVVWMDGELEKIKKYSISLTVPSGYFIILAYILVLPLMGLKQLVSRKITKSAHNLRFM